MVFMKRPALLIIDMQNDFVLDSSPMRVPQAKAVIPKILEVLHTFRSRKLPVFHLLRVHRADGSDVEIIRQEIFSKQPFAVEGTHGAAMISEIVPKPGEYIIPKTRMSGFIATELDLMLRNLKVSDIVVTGIQTPNCIRTTVFDAIAYNYPVVVVEDAVGAKTEEIHRANLSDMANIGVRLVKAKDIATVLD
jgi:nicotinamidase-related amidase